MGSRHVPCINVIFSSSPALPHLVLSTFDLLGNAQRHTAASLPQHMHVSNSIKTTIKGTRLFPLTSSNPSLPDSLGGVGQVTGIGSIALPKAARKKNAPNHRRERLCFRLYVRISVIISLKNHQLCPVLVCTTGNLTLCCNSPKPVVSQCWKY